MNVADRFSSIAKLWPDRIATRHRQDGQWHQTSYGELQNASRRLAAALVDAGVQPGDAVLVPARRHKDLLVHMLAILEAGGHYVVVDDSYPLPRQELIQQTAKARFGLRDAGDAGLNGLDVQWLEAGETLSNGTFPADRAFPALRPETPAYVMFTSGSTGTPKGVIVPHRAIVRLVVDTDFIRFSKDNVFLLHSSLSFDASTLEIWGALLHGACCVIFPDGEPLSARSLKTLMSEQPVNSLWLTSSLFNAIVDADAGALQGVEQLLTGGEAISPSHVRRAYAELPDISLFNGYGPTENTTFTTVYPVPRDLPPSATRVPIGFPINGTACDLYDDQLNLVTGSNEGELVAFGRGLSLGYLGNPKQTGERFVELQRSSGRREIGYRTGDIVRRLDTGAYDYLGRADRQVKIDGLRIELGEIEAALQALPEIAQARVLLRIGPKGQKRLAAYIVSEGGMTLDEGQCRQALARDLPAFMLPHFFLRMEVLPINANGKLDEAKLPDPFAVETAPRKTSSAKMVARCWRQVLQRDVEAHVNFLEAGGTSLEAIMLAEELSRASGADLTDMFVFEYPTIRAQEEYFDGLGDQRQGAGSEAFDQDDRQGDFAVIGMACRFPGASSVDEFWRNLLDAKESISFFSDEELLEAGVETETLQSQRYVKAKGIVDDADQFDAAFFEVSPLEADMLDPQQRIMLQLSWHALEDAGYPPGADALKAGVFVGANWPRYYQQNILNNKKALSRFGAFNAALGNEADFLSTRISYKLNLSGPSVNVFTACSTGLVAIAHACSALEKGQCDLALAGGVSISMPIKSGYMYQEGSMLSEDGHCRTFDADADGTTFNDGAGLVVLKRLDHAERDGDRIYAVVKGSAVNNDGANKASYTAPSIAGQVAVYKEALAAARVDPARVGFIETHGTATPLGDPIEVASLAQCYSTGGSGEKRCALGAVKSNIGHTIHASGVAGFIKAVLAVREGKIPATLHYQRPNPKLRLDETSFYVNAKTEDWEGEGPRIAAVSSLGVGGTNAHVIVQQHQAKEEAGDGQHPAISGSLPFLLSAKSEAALKVAMAAHGRFFADLPADADIADHAYTAALRKPHFNYRTALFAKNAGELKEQLETAAEAKFKKTDHGMGAAKAFMFTGQGSQRKQMGKSLLAHDDAYRTSWREGCAQLREDFGFDLHEIVFGDGAGSDDGLDIHQTSVAQPALFMLEYGIANWLSRRGCRPDFLIGHSIGEYAAAAIAGVLPFADALSIVAKRGQLMQRLPPGDMLAVFADREDIEPLLDLGVDLAGCNAPGQHVVSGEARAIDAAIRRLERQGKKSIRLKTSHAFHSRMMKPMLEEFAAYLQQFRFGSADIPIISTLSGKRLTDEEARSADYWVSQIHNPVRFSDALAEVAEQAEACAFIEVGPGSALKTLAAMHRFDIKASFLAALPGADANEGSAFEPHQLLGSLWRHGTPLDWKAWFDHEAPGRLFQRRTLPLYAFDTKRHWIDPPEPEQALGDQPTSANDTRARPQSNHLTLVTDLGPTPMAKSEAADNGYDKKSLVTKKLVEVFEDVTGFDLEDVEPGAHFSEAGLDSLMLTQIATALQQEFGGDITFRNLMEDYASFDDLTAFYLDIIPVDEPQAPAMEAAPAAAPFGTVAAHGSLPQMPMPQIPAVQAGQGTLLEQVSLQLQIVQLQLQSLGFQQALPQMPAPQAAAPVPAPANAARPASAAASGLEVVKSDDAKPKKSHGPGVRIAKQSIGVDLSNAQRAWIDGKLTEYQKTFAGSKACAEEHRRYFADPRTVSGFNPEWKEIIFQLVVKGSKGSRLFDVDGNELIDITNGFGPIFFGHSPDFVSEAVKRQIDLGIETGPQSPLAGEVARLFCDITGNERCTFASSGSEAVLGAIRLARTVTGRQTVVMFSGAYHGICDEAIARPGKNHQALPSAPGITREALANMRVLPWAEEESIDIISEMKDQVAAVLVEPVQSRNPGFHDADYIRKLRDVTRDSGSALILDEVVTGFRVAPGGIQQRFDVDADLAVYGKVVGGGYPIGIIGGKSKFMDALDGGFWRYGDDSIPEAGVTFFAGTFVRHPLALAATKAVLTKIQEEGPALYDELEKKTAALATEARSFVQELECGVKLDEFASLFYISVPDTAHWGHLLYVLMQLEGVFVQQYRPCFLTTEHSEQDIESVLKAFKRSLAQLVEQGLIEGNIGNGDRQPTVAKIGVKRSSRFDTAGLIDDSALIVQQRRVASL